MKKAPLLTVRRFVFTAFFILLSACSATKEIRNDPLLSSEYRLGTHYKKIPPQATDQLNDGRIEVIEVFFYACPHCNALESKIQSWLEDKDDIVNFRRMPAILGPTWGDQAKAFYVAEKLGITDTIHPALLKAIHIDKRQFYNEYNVMEFFVEQGIERQAFIDAYNSSEVAEKVNQARIMTVKYALRGVPAIIVNGKYKTAQFYTGSQERMLEVVDLLITRERALINK